MRARTSSGARRRLWLSVACAAATVHGAGGAASGSNPTATNRGTAPAEATVPGPSPAQILARYIQAERAAPGYAPTYYHLGCLYQATFQLFAEAPDQFEIYIRRAPAAV